MELKYKEISEKILGASFQVHNYLGNGFTHFKYFISSGIRECFAIQEVIYQRAAVPPTLFFGESSKSTVNTTSIFQNRKIVSNSRKNKFRSVDASQYPVRYTIENEKISKFVKPVN